MSDNDDRILLEKVRELENADREKDRGRSPDPENTASVLGEHRRLSQPLTNSEAIKRMSVYSRRGFIVGGAAALLGIFGWR